MCTFNLLVCYRLYGYNVISVRVQLIMFRSSRFLYCLNSSPCFYHFDVRSTYTPYIYSNNTIGCHCHRKIEKLLKGLTFFEFVFSWFKSPKVIFPQPRPIKKNSFHVESSFHAWFCDSNSTLNIHAICVAQSVFYLFCLSWSLYAFASWFVGLLMFCTHFNVFFLLTHHRHILFAFRFLCIFTTA